MAIRHLVLIRPAAGVAEAELEAVLAHAASMEHIDGVISVSFARAIGPDDSPRGKGISHVLTVVLDDPAALEAYRPHPLHREFGALLMPMTGDITIIDIAE